MQDYSTHHEPVSELFKHQGGEKQLRLSETQLADYKRDGFVGGVPLLSTDQIAALREELAELFTPEHEGHELWYEYHCNESTDPGSVLFHALGAWRLRPGLHDVLWNPKMLLPASQLLEGAVRFWHDQLFCKPAGDGGVVAWHQDYSYWTRTKPMAHLTCWIGLDDSTVENGCLHYVPKSHRWPLLPTTNLAGGMEAIKGVLNEEQLGEFQPVACEMPAGYASFHHPLTLHGSYENRSERPRRAIVINLFRDGTISDQDEPLMPGTAAIARGEKMGGQFHPLLFSPETRDQSREAKS